LMIDRLRSRQRSAVRDQAWQRGQVMEVAGAPVVDAPGADEVVASRQRLNALVEAVSSLPPQTARAFRMHKLEGLSHAETAAAMGVSK
ncbi:RNA polymerase sigma factor, partial [Escherichia coli]|uniref:RNA polymerase sigma factor n=3 Tax=Pseudomonadota TaxID=1224 RepID=UPI00207C3518